jgi:cold shock CspA family protein
LNHKYLLYLCRDIKNVMGRSQESRSKKEIRTKKEKKRKEKAVKRLERKEKKGTGGPDEMLAYVDEYGNITDTPPDMSQRKKIIAEDIEISVPKGVPVDPRDLIRKGIVSFFNDSKGFGFIRDTTTQESIFVHVRGLTEPIKENNKVIFEVENGPKGPNAVNVKIDRT